MSTTLADWLRRFVECSRKGHKLKELPMEVYCLRCGWHQDRPTA